MRVDSCSYYHSLTSCVTTHTQYPTRPADIIQIGDLIWPKPPGAIIPRSQLGEGTGKEAVEWELEKEEYVAQLKAKQNLTSIEEERVRRLERMTYADFGAQ